MSQNSEARRAATILVSPAVLLLLALNVFPIAFAVYISLRHWSLSSPNPPRYAGWFNYEELTWDDRFINSLWVSATFILIAVLIELLLGFALAFVFNSKLKGLDALRKLSLLPVMTMPLVVGLVWFYMLNENFGVINWFVTLFGSERLPFLTDKTPCHFVHRTCRYLAMDALRHAGDIRGAAKPARICIRGGPHGRADRARNLLEDHASAAAPGDNRRAHHPLDRCVPHGRTGLYDDQGRPWRRDRGSALLHLHHRISVT